MEGKSTPLSSDHTNLGRAAHISARLQSDLRRRCVNVSVRGRGPRRIGRALQRRTRRALARARDAHLPACVWLNPVPEKEWGYTQSITMVHQLMGGRMYPLTLDGLDRATRELAR